MGTTSQLVQLPVNAARQSRFMVIDADGAIRCVHHHAEQLIGLPSEIMVGINAFTFFHVDDVPTLMSIISEALMRPGQSRPVELRVRREGESWRAVTLSAVHEISSADGGTIAFHLCGPDATVRTADQIVREALHDRITDLPNRALFIDRVDHAIARGARKAQPVVVLMVGFNGFDSRSLADRETTSDELVVAVALRLRSCLRSSDSMSRIKHDEFGVLLEDVADTGHVKIIADRIFRAMEVPFFDGGAERVLVPSIGLVTSTPDRQRAIDLLRAASIARAWASVQGPGGYAEYDPTMAAPEGEEATSQYELNLDESAFLSTPPHSSNGTEVSQLMQRLAVLEQTVASLSGSASLRHE